MISIPENVKEILKHLNESDKQAYVVGGAVRDILCDKKPHDWDITTNASPQEVMRLFSGYNCFPSGIEYGTVTVYIGNEGYEITTFRKDGSYSDGRHPDSVSYAKSIETDLSRRDFTINAMAMDIDGNITDPFGGQKDLKEGIIRCVGDPKDRFREDALRMMRAIRFAAVNDFVVDEHILKEIYENRKNINLPSGERIRKEFEKILTSKHPGYGIRLLQSTELLKEICPELDKCFGCEQNNKYHYEDVGNHCISVMCGVSDSFPLRMAALLHDVGKPVVMAPKNDDSGEYRFAGHGKVSAEIADRFCRKLRIDNRMREYIVSLVKQHDTVYLEDADIRRFAAEHDTAFLYELHDLQVADSKAHQGEFVAEFVAEKEVFYMKMMSFIEDNTAITKAQMNINGNDLKDLGLEGKDIGDCMEYLYTECLKCPEINRRDELMALADNFTDEINKEASWVEEMA